MKSCKKKINVDGLNEINRVGAGGALHGNPAANTSSKMTAATRTEACTLCG